MEIRRAAIIFDTTLRPETAGVYCQRTLEKLVVVEHFQPHDFDRVPRNGFDLYLNIDDGLPYQLPSELRPSAFWAIDTHLNFDRCRGKAPGFDVVFAAQRDGFICFGASAFLRRLGCLSRVILRFIAMSDKAE
jgi:O-antigen biosynthesis protein